jgi:hypothetical protein
MCGLERTKSNREFFVVKTVIKQGKPHKYEYDRLCGLVVRVLGYRSGGPGSIPGTTKNSSRSGTGSTQPRD